MPDKEARRVVTNPISEVLQKDLIGRAFEEAVESSLREGRVGKCYRIINTYVTEKTLGPPEKSQWGYLEPEDLAAFNKMVTSDDKGSFPGNITRDLQVRLSWMYIMVADVIENAEENEMSVPKETRELIEKLSPHLEGQASRLKQTWDFQAYGHIWMGRLEGPKEVLKRFPPGYYKDILDRYWCLRRQIPEDDKSGLDWLDRWLQRFIRVYKEPGTAIQCFTVWSMIHDAGDECHEGNVVEAWCKSINEFRHDKVHTGRIDDTIDAITSRMSCKILELEKESGLTGRGSNHPSIIGMKQMCINGTHILADLKLRQKMRARGEQREFNSQDLDAIAKLRKDSIAAGLAEEALIGRSGHPVNVWFDEFMRYIHYERVCSGYAFNWIQHCSDMSVVEFLITCSTSSSAQEERDLIKSMHPKINSFICELKRFIKRRMSKKREEKTAAKKRLQLNYDVSGGDESRDNASRSNANDPSVLDTSTNPANYSSLVGKEGSVESLGMPGGECAVESSEISRNEQILRRMMRRMSQQKANNSFPTVGLEHLSTDAGPAPRPDLFSPAANISPILDGVAQRCEELNTAAEPHPMTIPETSKIPAQTIKQHSETENTILLPVLTSPALKALFVSERSLGSEFASPISTAPLPISKAPYMSEISAQALEKSNSPSKESSLVSEKPASASEGSVTISENAVPVPCIMPHTQANVADPLMILNVNKVTQGGSDDGGRSKGEVLYQGCQMPPITLGRKNDQASSSSQDTEKRVKDGHVVERMRHLDPVTMKENFPGLPSKEKQHAEKHSTTREGFAKINEHDVHRSPGSNKCERNGELIIRHSDSESADIAHTRSLSSKALDPRAATGGSDGDGTGKKSEIQSSLKDGGRPEEAPTDRPMYRNLTFKIAAETGIPEDQATTMVAEYLRIIADARSVPGAIGEDGLVNLEAYKRGIPAGRRAELAVFAATGPNMKDRGTVYTIACNDPRCYQCMNDRRYHPANWTIESGVARSLAADQISEQHRQLPMIPFPEKEPEKYGEAYTAYQEVYQANERADFAQRTS